MAKTIRPGGKVVGYDNAKHFAVQEYEIAGLPALARLLIRIVKNPQMCIVRGALINGPKASHIRRLKYPDKATKEPATFRDVWRYWLALDFDSLPLPKDVRADDLVECAS